MHGAAAALFLWGAALLSRPRMSYYSVDLIGSFPSGAAGGGAAVQSAPVKNTAPTPAPAPVPTPKVSPKAFIKLPGKDKKPPAAARPAPKAAVKPAAHPSTGSGAGTAQGPGGGEGGANGSGITASAGGVAFPYPWYMKLIADKINRQWKPQNFQPGTTCVVSFAISRNGQVSEPTMEKASGDPLFDTYATRAITYAGQMPELPTGYPDPTLTVHMTFQGQGAE